MTRIRECGRSIGGGTVVFDIEWEGELGAGDQAFMVSITSSDGREQVRLVHARPGGGAPPSQYVEADAGRQEVDVDADLADDHLTARFPAEVVGVAVEWPVWQAALMLDGSPVAEAVIPTT